MPKWWDMYVHIFPTSLIATSRCNEKYSILRIWLDNLFCLFFIAYSTYRSTYVILIFFNLQKLYVIFLLFLPADCSFIRYYTSAANIHVSMWLTKQLMELTAREKEVLSECIIYKSIQKIEQQILSMFQSVLIRTWNWLVVGYFPHYFV